MGFAVPTINNNINNKDTVDGRCSRVFIADFEQLFTHAHTITFDSEHSFICLKQTLFAKAISASYNLSSNCRATSCQSCTCDANI